MKNLIQSILIVTLCVFINTGLTLAQDIDGEYSASGTNEVTIEDKKMVVTRSVYEFYGQANTEYRYTYTLIWVDENLLRLKLKRSKITGGPKRFGGAGRRHPNYRNPGYDGTYEVHNVGENVELRHHESSEKTIVLKRNFQKGKKQ